MKLKSPGGRLPHIARGGSPLPFDPDYGRFAHLPPVLEELMRSPRRRGKKIGAKNGKGLPNRADEERIEIGGQRDTGPK